MKRRGAGWVRQSRNGIVQKCNWNIIQHRYLKGEHDETPANLVVITTFSERPKSGNAGTNTGLCKYKCVIQIWKPLLTEEDWPFLVVESSLAIHTSSWFTRTDNHLNLEGLEAFESKKGINQQKIEFTIKVGFTLWLNSQRRQHI